MISYGLVVIVEDTGHFYDKKHGVTERCRHKDDITYIRVRFVDSYGRESKEWIEEGKLSIVDGDNVTSNNDGKDIGK